MAENAGKVLTDDERAEYQSYINNRLPLPDKFANVVIDNTSASGMVFRYATDEARKAAAQEAERVAKAEKTAADVDQKVRAEAARRRQASPDLPEAPADMENAPTNTPRGARP